MEELQQIGKALGFAITSSRMKEMIRRANLVRAERAAQKRISSSSRIYRQAIQSDPTHWSLYVSLAAVARSDGLTTYRCCWGTHCCLRDDQKKLCALLKVRSAAWNLNAGDGKLRRVKW
eukprot:753270-Hanusia_phi.AAC.5